MVAVQVQAVEAVEAVEAVQAFQAVVKTGNEWTEHRLASCILPGRRVR